MPPRNGKGPVGSFVHPGLLVKDDRGGEPSSRPARRVAPGRARLWLRDALLGAPLPNDADREERVGPLAGVPILGLDALASAAYGPEALLTVLLGLGVAGLKYVTPLTLLIVAILVVVFFSYRQTIERLSQRRRRLLRGEGEPGRASPRSSRRRRSPSTTC